MSSTNLVALAVSLSYPGQGGGTVKPPTITVNAPFEASVAGYLDVPDAVAGSTAYSIPFGSIGVGASFVYLKNSTGQDLTLKINGSAALNKMKDGEILIMAGTALSATPVTALSLTTTATQSGAGKIEYLVAGDPV